MIRFTPQMAGVRMCGINGIFAYHYAANPIDRAELARTRDHMAARGPDGAAAWVDDDGRTGLAHRRLAIIDLSKAGVQPMTSADGKLVVTFNGEIYNYRQLRIGLEARGRIFCTKSDTEVLLHLYAEKGAALVHDLRGMFAFAIWDAERRIMLLARDPYGIKPLYFADDGWTFRFASQVKALLAGSNISRNPDPAGQVGFLLWGSVPEPFTTYQAIRAVPAGTTLLVDRMGAREPQRYHKIAQVYRDAEAARPLRASPSEAEISATIRGALIDSVRHHLVADVPIGAFLSSGIDSGALVGLMCDAGQRDIQTVTLAFEEFRGQATDEAVLAQEVANVYGTRHTTRVVTETEFKTDLPHILHAMDQPTIDGVNTWFVAKAAHELGLKVAVSGIGGDELFGGYPSFSDIPRWVRTLRAPSRIPGLGRVIRWAGQQLGPAFSQSPKVAGMLELGGTYAGAYLLRRGLFMPWELAQILDREVVMRGLRRLSPLRCLESELVSGPRSAHALVATLESAFYLRNQLLRDADWASMAHSLEVRVPLVDSFLLSEVALAQASTRTHVQSDASKRVLAHSPSLGLPESITGRAKTGFTTPIAQWLRNARPNSAAVRRPWPAITPHWSRQWAEFLAVA